MTTKTETIRAPKMTLNRKKRLHLDIRLTFIKMEIPILFALGAISLVSAVSILVWYL